MRRRSLILSAMVLSLLLGSASGAAAQETLSQDILVGWGYFQSGSYRQAVDAWQEFADRERDGSDPAILRQAGFASVLSAMALERLESARAYDRWADAIRFYLKANSSWEQERLVLAQRAEIWRDAVRRDPEAVVHPGSMDILLMDLASKLDLRAYNGPGPGLGAEEAAAPAVPGAAGYMEIDPAIGSEITAGESRHAGLTASVTEDVDPPPDVSISRPDMAEEAREATSENGKEGPLGFTMAIIPVSDPAPESQAGANDETLAGRESGSIQNVSPASTARAPSNAAHITNVLSDLSQFEGEWARIAWSYFRSNRQPATGLVNSKSGYAYATVWDMGNMLAGEISANQLGLTTDTEFRQNLQAYLNALENLPLVQQSLPNREYDLRTLQMVDIEGKLSPEGSGWSAVDLGRLLVWLRIAAQFYPDYRDRVSRIVESWNFSPSFRGGRLQASLRKEGSHTVFQEGRFGDEQYAAAGFSLFDMVPTEALSYGAVRRLEMPAGFLLDARQPALVTGDPFFLATVELGGIDDCFREGTRQQWDSQLQHSQETGSPVSWSEESIGQSPWYVFSTIRTQDAEWLVASYDRKPRPELANYSFKAAVAWNTLYPGTPNGIPVNLPQRLVTGSGFRAGMFTDGRLNDVVTLSTNATVLEILWYRQRNARSFLEFINPVSAACPVNHSGAKP